MPRALERRTFLLIGGFAVAVRIALIATTFGTNDVVFTAAWADLVTRAGISHAYAFTRMLNHPPLSLAIFRALHAVPFAWGDVLRFVQVLADVVTAIALYRIGGRTSIARAQQLSLFVLLSPAAVFLSAFHGNTDPTMTALLVVAVALFERPLWCAIALALSCGIKIVPFLVAPIFFVMMPPRARLIFAVTFGVAVAVLFLPAIAIGGPVVVRNIFGYAGNLPYEWGFPGVAFAISRNVPGMRAAGDAAMRGYMAIGRYVEYAGILAVLALAGWRRQHLPHAVEIMLLTVLALAPGFGVQYTCWILPLLPFALRWRGAVAMNAALSVFLFITYTVWSGGWPWWFADLARPGPNRSVAALAGCTMWLLVCVTLAVAIVRFTRTPPPETAR